MSEILQLIDNKNNEMTSVQEKIEITNSLNEKEDLINKLNNIINEKIQLSKIYDTYIIIKIKFKTKRRNKYFT